MDIKDVSLKAVILGFLADCAASILGDSLIAIWYMLISDTESAKKILEGLNTSSNYLSISLVVGLLSTLLGGYVAGRVAKTHQLLNASSAAIMSMILGILLSGRDSTWFDIAYYILAIPVAMMGGMLSIRKEREAIISSP